MFRKILIANRGEIACRIIRTCRRMGIATVAVYSEADCPAPHVKLADEAVAIGPARAAQSYLSIPNLLEVCRQTGADAVHPGYGFLSERAEFASALTEAGIVFIGPDAHAIAAMGDKIEAKKLARAAGVNSVPGALDIVADTGEAAAIAAAIGYPVMIKASAGGGGKGMRLAGDPVELREGFASAQREAQAAFGDDRLFVEKFIERPRHIEIQILADGHGNILHLGERECSIQRRHQKVIEESPSPLATPEMRVEMGAQAVALARAVDYRSAGTVEFIVDPERRFYFLEMNTRLQVEHPVTELVTGLDLVEWMIRIAAGERLELRQEEVRLSGWAMEARIYAEDPFRGFLPATGRLNCYRPWRGEGLRLDDGVEEGGEIGVHYDPMIGKLCAHGATRDEAVDRLCQGLDGFTIQGVGHNLPFLGAVLAHPRFRAGALSTGFIAEEFPDGFKGGPPDTQQARVLIAVAAAAETRLAERAATLTGRAPGSKAGPPEEWVVGLSGHESRCVVWAEGNSSYRVGVEGETLKVATGWRPGQPLMEAEIDGARVLVQIERRGLCWRLSQGGVVVEARALSPRAAELAARMQVKLPPDLSCFVLSPMPGLLVSLAVVEGQEVREGDIVAVIEAMKMENLLRAERDGVIAKLHAYAGDSVAADQKIAEFREAGL